VCVCVCETSLHTSQKIKSVPNKNAKWSVPFRKQSLLGVRQANH